MEYSNDIPIKKKSFNPMGRPIGSFSLVNILKKKLLEIPKGQKRSYAELLIEKAVKKAIEDGDTTMIKELMNRVDGMPQQDITSGGESIIPHVAISTLRPKPKQVQEPVIEGTIASDSEGNT